MKARRLLPVARSLRLFLLGLEFCVLFFGVPLAVEYGLLPGNVLLVLWKGAAICLVALLASRTFSARSLGKGDATRAMARRVAMRFGLAAALLAGLVVIATPDFLFSFVRRAPVIWAVVMLLYPLLSVYPQGLIYRSFLFHRYRPLLPLPWMRIAASAVAFSFMHIVFGTLIAPALTLIGGALFASTYERSRSQLLASVEHALYGCFIFTIGWGQFFYYGARHASG